MDNNKRQLLERYYRDIINDLDVSFILDELFSKRAITSEDFDEIYTKRDRAEQTQSLLKSLLRNGTNSSYEAFVDSLAKDYSWLWEKLVIENNHPMANDSFEDSLSRGDVPRLPDHHVRRLSLEENVATKLRQLTRHKILVLHGMSGSGKTCVAISTLRHNPELITNNFNGVVFWLNLGNCKTDDDIVAQQNKLLRKASSIYVFHSSSFMNSSVSMSSISSDIDNISLSNYNWKWEDLRDKLKTQFLKQPLKESLLVLDEVNEKKCLEAFDIGCKIFLTTRDTEVVANYRPQIVKIENSLEEKESLEIFALCVDIPVSKLPGKAKKIHDICKGSPFHIGLIGAQLAEDKERLIHDPDRWDDYYKKLKKKEYFLFPRYHTNNPLKTIEFCINSLNEDISTLFKKLKILPDNVKVSAKVLSKLWNKQVNEVETIMKGLRSKSLIIESYDREQRSYMYEIHDLIMNYLRSTDDEDSKKLNDDFLNSYHYNNTSKAPVDITDDGYIAYYIGFHIKNTGNMNNKWNLFNTLYMDLNFLGNKVRLTGSADVILDLQKYEHEIVKDELDRDLINNIRAYLSTHGRDLHRYPCTDIVQSILQHESKGILYTKAMHVAQEKCAKNELYFEFLHEQNVEEIKHSTIDVKENITAVCFFGDYVLIGTNSGLIKFFYVPTNKLRKELRGPGAAVKWIGVACSQNPPIVAALAYDGVVMLWRLDDTGHLDSDRIIEEESEEYYNNNYTDIETIHPKLGPYINCRWSNNEEILIMHTESMVVFYNPSMPDNKRIYKTIDNFERDRNLLCCVPCNHDRFVIVATYGDPTSVEVIDLKTKEKIITFEETDIVLDIVTVPDSNKFITLKSNEIMEHEVKINTHSLKSNNSTYRSRRVIASDQVKDNLHFISIAVNKTGSLLFVSTDDSRVICVDLKNYAWFDLENRRGNVVAMDVSEVIIEEFVPGPDVLLTGTDTTDDSAKVWYLDASYLSQKAQRNGKVRLTTKFDVSFLHPVSPQTPSSSTPNSGTESATNTPKRHQSFANHKEITKKMLKNTMSLDRHSLKPLNLKGIGNNNDGGIQPLLAVVDDKNNIQVMRGRKVLTEITEKSDASITKVKMSPCNQYVVYGLKSGTVKRFTLRTKEIVTITDVYSPVSYLNFVNPNMLIVAGKNRCLMAYRLSMDGTWKLEMLQKGNCHLGSQEILNGLEGVKKKNGQSEKISSSSSDASLSSKERLFPSGETKSLCKTSGVVGCFWVEDLGLITVEYNATIKLWDKSLKLSTILNGRQSDVCVSLSSLQNNILVICDKYNKGFQTFEVKVVDGVEAELQAIQEYKLNNEIISCDLTTDGNILAMGLDSGNVVVWNVKGKRQLTLLKHHKNKVNYCSFSPVPERLFHSSAQSPFTPHSPETCESEPPLVLVTMATEIVWWNISYLLNTRTNKFIRRSGYNALTPLGSPLECRYEQQSADNSNSDSTKYNFFFGDGHYLSQQCWRDIWKGKTCKEGSKKKEILACIKLAGMNARAIYHDDKFSCFVTVDNPGHVHIMNVMRPNNT